MRKAALATLALLALAAPALADVNGGTVKSGRYKGTTAKGKSVKFTFAGSALHGFHLNYRMSCTSGHTISPTTNIQELGPISGKHGSFTAHGSGRFSSLSPPGHYELLESIAVHFPSDHVVAGTFSAVDTITNSVGAKVDTCTLRPETWSANRQ